MRRYLYFSIIVIITLLLAIGILFLLRGDDNTINEEFRNMSNNAIRDSFEYMIIRESDIMPIESDQTMSTVMAGGGGGGGGPSLNRQTKQQNQISARTAGKKSQRQHRLRKIVGKVYPVKGIFYDSVVL